MRITLVMASAEDGGLEKHVLELTAALSAQHDVSLIAHQRFASQLQGSAQFIAMDLSGSRHNPWTKYQLKKHIFATKPDVVHVHAAKTAQLVQNMLPGFPFPAVVTVHGKKKKSAVNQKFDRIIVVSQQLKDQFEPSEKVDVVYNGIAHVQVPQPFVKNRKFIAIGRLNEVKGFDVLLEAWQDIEYSLTIAGEGEERTKLEKLIKEYDLSSRVQLIGHSNEIQKLITEHEALIVSSLREGGPYTLGEALLLERPVIGTDVGMMSEFIDAQWLCPTQDVKALQDLIQKYVQLEAPQALFQSAFLHAQQHLTQAHMLQSTLEVYQRAIADKTA